MHIFLAKTLREIRTLFSDLFDAENAAANHGLLQALDPRFKLLALLSLNIAVNLSSSPRQLTAFGIYLTGLVCLSRLPFWRFCKRIAVISLFFTGLISIPALFNWVRPGDPLWRLTASLYITRQGVASLILLVLRSCLSLGFVFLLTTTTKWSNVLKALRVLGIPALFVATLEMAHRYIFLCLELAAQTFTARQSRAVGKSNSREGRRFVAAATGNLLIGTSLLGDSVYQAMLSRGYSGTPQTLDRFQISNADWVWAGTNLAVIITIFRYI